MPQETISPPIAAFIAALTPGQEVRSEYLAQVEAHGDLAALVDAFARSEHSWLNLGGWEVGLLNEETARGFLKDCGGLDLLDRHERFLVIGNDVGELTAVVGWSRQVPEVVYECDQEYATAKPLGTVAAWLVHLALIEAAPDFSMLKTEGLAAQVNPITLEEVDDLPPDPNTWTPPDEAVAAKLKGSAHLGFVDLGVVAAVHKKGVRAWIDGKKKVKNALQYVAWSWDAAGELVWFKTSKGAGCVTLPGLEVAVREHGLEEARQIIALADGVAFTNVDGCLQLLERAGDSVRPSYKYQTGFNKHVFTVGSRGAYIACGDWEVQRILLYRWDGTHLRVQGGWRGSLGWLRERDGVLYTNIADDRGARVLGLPPQQLD